MGRGYYSDIAIDDVKLVSSCPNPGKLDYAVYISNNLKYSTCILCSICMLNFLYVFAFIVVNCVVSHSLWKAIAMGFVNDSGCPCHLVLFLHCKKILHCAFHSIRFSLYTAGFGSKTSFSYAFYNCKVYCCSCFLELSYLVVSIWSKISLTRCMNSFLTI